MKSGRSNLVSIWINKSKIASSSIWTSRNDIKGVFRQSVKLYAGKRNYNQQGLVEKM